MKRKKPKKNTVTITTSVVPVTSLRPGHDTLLSSFRVFLRKSMNPRNLFINFLKKFKNPSKKSFMGLIPQMLSRQSGQLQLK
jgi:hypothetical protein